MKILALITARGGSKRIPGKNTKVLGGKCLIVWSIDIVKNISDICDILVSTDDQGIANVAQQAGAIVPWLRPANLANDTALSVDVALHALDFYELKNGKIDGLLLLQPTSPFRSRQTVLRGIEMFRQNQDQAVIGVSPAHSHPLWCFKVNGREMKPFINDCALSLRSQDLPPAYEVNGAFYLIGPNELRTNKSFYKAGMAPLVMDDRQESLDIDTEWDWKVAESVLNVSD